MYTILIPFLYDFVVSLTLPKKENNIYKRDVLYFITAYVARNKCYWYEIIPIGQSGLVLYSTCTIFADPHSFYDFRCLRRSLIKHN